MGQQPTDGEGAFIEQGVRKRASEVLFADEQKLDEGDGIEAEPRWTKIQVVAKLARRRLPKATAQDAMQFGSGLRRHGYTFLVAG